MIVNQLTIFLDLDGVMADWIASACDLCGVDLNNMGNRTHLSRPGAKLQHLIDESYMWEKITEAGAKFWSEIPLFPWSERLYDELDLRGDVCFLTAPGDLPYSPMAAAGKTLWVDRYFPSAKILIGNEKGLCASSTSLLIDDSEDNIVSFIAGGGHAAKFPPCLALLDGVADLEAWKADLWRQIEAIQRNISSPSSVSNQRTRPAVEVCQP